MSGSETGNERVATHTAVSVHRPPPWRLWLVVPVGDCPRRPGKRVVNADLSESEAGEFSWSERRPDMPRLRVPFPVRAHTRIKPLMHT